MNETLLQPSSIQISIFKEMKQIAKAGILGTEKKVKALQEAIDKQQEIENFHKKLFDIINDEVIGMYELERKWLDGKCLKYPITEQDIQDFSRGKEDSRLWNDGKFSPKRINEFDGKVTKLLFSDYNELDLLSEQKIVLKQLYNGFSSKELSIKTVKDNAAQNFMYDLIARLKVIFSSRIAAIENMLNALIKNKDYNLDITIKTDLQHTLKIITKYLTNIEKNKFDIDEKSIKKMLLEVEERQEQINKRIQDIEKNIIKGDFRNKRFDTVEYRCRLNNGSIILLKNLIHAKEVIKESGKEAKNLAKRYEKLLLTS